MCVVSIERFDEIVRAVWKMCEREWGFGRAERIFQGYTEGGRENDSNQPPFPWRVGKNKMAAFQC